jgi:serine protease AprX
MNKDRSASNAQSLHQHAVRGFTWRLPVLTVATIALALGTAPAVTASAQPADAAVTQTMLSLVGDDKKADDAEWGDDDARMSETATVNGRYQPNQDLSSLYSINRRIGAQQSWTRGFTGSGVTVAVIDTGVTRVKGLDGVGKVVNGPDLSYESQRPGTRYLDGFGHGTHMAGIIAGQDAELRTTSSPFAFAGVAPDARILNMKVARA